MSTGQNYGADGYRPNPIEPTEGSSPSTAPAAAQPLPRPDHRPFIQRLTELSDLPVEQLILAINDRLSQTPLFYANVLTGIDLLRTIQSLAGTDLAAHYVLLLRSWQIVGVAMIPVITGAIKTDLGPLLCNHRDETRPLLRTIFDHDATKVLLATTRSDSEYCFSPTELDELDQLVDALNTFGVEMLDYLLFYADLNVSRTFDEYGNEGLDEEVTINRIEVCGLPNPMTADQSTTLTLN